MINKLDKAEIRNILSIRYDPTKKTLIKPASIYDFLKDTSDSKAKKTESLLKNATEKLIKSERGSITVSLSGGIDSTLALAILRDVFPKKKIIGLCGVFEEGFDESIFAKKIAQKFDSDFKIVKMGSIFTNMPEIISITSKPKWNTYTHLIAKNAKKYGKFLITGDGSDEIFGGYIFRYSKFLNLHRPKDNWKTRIINYLECHNRDWVPDQEQLFDSSIRFDWNYIYKYFEPFFKNNLNPIKQVMLADFNGKLLHDFIPMTHDISKKYEIGIGSPYLDNDVIAHGLKLPISQKFDTNTKQGKLTLRKISKRYEIKHIEEKKGFSPNLINDWNKHGRSICQSYLMSNKSRVFTKKLINHNWVIRAFEKVEDDGDIRYLNRLISILALEIWYRIFVTKEMKPNQKL